MGRTTSPPTTDPTRLSRRTVFGCGLALLSLPAIGQAGSGRPNLKSLDEFITREMREARIPGLAVGVAREGAVQRGRVGR